MGPQEDDIIWQRSIQGSQQRGLSMGGCALCWGSLPALLMMMSAHHAAAAGSQPPCDHAMLVDLYPRAKLGLTGADPSVDCSGAFCAAAGQAPGSTANSCDGTHPLAHRHAHLGAIVAAEVAAQLAKIPPRDVMKSDDDDGGDDSTSRSRSWWPKPPAIHFTPEGMRTMPPHDIAGVLFDERTGIWWLWVYGIQVTERGQKYNGWQLCSSTNLVDWKLHGLPTVVGGTGSVLVDPRTNDTLLVTNNIQLWRGRPGSPAGTPWTSGFEAPLQIARPCNPDGDSKDCGDAPTIFFDERVDQYCILTMFGHRTPANRFNGTRGWGLAYQSCSSNVSGGYVLGKTPWLELDGPVHLRGAPGAGIVNQTQEFLSVDFFPLPAAASDGASGDWAFLSTTYGQTHSNRNEYHDFASIFIGKRPAPLGAFTPDMANTSPLDWSAFTVANSSSDSADIALARAHGMEQYGCCPKTGGSSTRRVVFGGLANGWNQGVGCHDGWNQGVGCENRTVATITSNNTLALPRDLSAAADGTLRQAFVPELQTCRRQHMRMSNISLDASTGGRGSPRFVETEGTQLEIIATFKLPSEPLSKGQFGVVVLSSGVAEHTAIAFDQARGHVLLDRSRSGAPGLQGNDDVRAGPWLNGDGDPSVLRLHAFVDNQIVSLIANNETAISAWVDPTLAASNRVGLFAELGAGESVQLLSLDVWQIAIERAPTAARLKPEALKTDDGVVPPPPAGLPPPPPDLNGSVVVFSAGLGGVANYRIPAIVQTTGTGSPPALVAFAEARDGDDFSASRIAVRTSTDAGETWSAVTFAAGVYSPPSIFQ